MTFAWAMTRVQGTKVLIFMVEQLFALELVDWTPIDHFESFAGDAAVTLAELQASKPNW